MDVQTSLSLINTPQRLSGELPLFDKQEVHCLRISTRVVEWHVREDVTGATDTFGLDGGRAWVVQTSSAVTSESHLV